MCIDCDAKVFAAEAYKAFHESGGRALVLFATEAADGTTDVNFISQMEVESSKELLKIAGSPDEADQYEAKEQLRMN